MSLTITTPPTTVLDLVDETQVAASASRAAGSWFSEIFNTVGLGYSDLMFRLNVTDVTGGATVAVAIEYFDPGTGAWTTPSSFGLNYATVSTVTFQQAIFASATFKGTAASAQLLNSCGPLVPRFRFRVTVATAAATFSLGMISCRQPYAPLGR
jgi:hypothetical protein